MKHISPVSGVAAYRDLYVASAGYDNQLILWRAASREPIARACHDHLANMCAFSPDGRVLATASSDHTARLWSVPDLKLLAVYAHHDDDVEMVAISPIGDRVATACRDHTARVFALDGRLIASMRGHRADVISVAWSTAGTEIITSSDDGTVRVWNSSTGEQIHVIEMNGIETDTLVISHDATIYAGNDAGEISIVRAGTVKSIRAHQVGVKRLILDRSGRLVSLSYDRTFTVWNLAPDGELIPGITAEMPPEIWPRSCAFLGTTKLVFATFGSSFATYDLQEASWDLSGIAPTGGVNAVLWHDNSVLTVGDAGIVRQNGQTVQDLKSLCNFLVPFAGTVLTGGQMGRVHDALTGELIYTHRSPLNCGVGYISQAQAKVVIGSYTGEGLVFGVSDNGRPAFERTLQLHSNAIKGVAANTDTIFSVSAATSAAWNSTPPPNSSVAFVEHGHDRIANGCAAVNGCGFASVSRDRKLRRWTSDGRLIAVIDTPHTHSIKCIAASDDGRIIATASYNGRVALYDCTECRWVFDRRLTTWGISSLATAPHGFLAGSYDGNVYPITL